MKCPKCSGEAKYKVSRKQFWKNKKSVKAKEPREDFIAKCKKCKFIFDAKEVYGDLVVSEVVMKEEKHQQIKMKYTEKEKETNRQ